VGARLEPELIEELNRFRGDAPGASACAAPFVNMHFSQMGVVSACCFNRTHVLGVYPKNSIEEIWRGRAIQEIRDAMDQWDLSKGCEKCVQTIKARDFGGTHAVYYSLYTHLGERERLEWGMPKEGDPALAPLPLRLEFNIHNSCNLQCVMCHGLASSSIRSHREGLPPIENPYDDKFVDQLEPYLPFVVEADFMGGEPFMIPVYMTLWQRIASRNPRMKVCILTNGTILDDKIRTMLEGFNSWMHVSIDSVFKNTYEYIRRGASYEQVMENCAYYNQLMKKRGYPFVYRFCPMRLNWREIPDTIQHCNERGIILSFNQLDSPVNLSLATLPAAELETVVSFLQKHVPAASKNDIEEANLKNYVEMVQRLEGFIDPKNRLQGVQMRLETAAAVVSQYSKGKEKRSRRGASTITVPLAEESDALHQAAKRYLIAQLNLDQALGQGLDLPKAIHKTVAKCLADLKVVLAGTEKKTFISVYLNELIRTYSGVWGVPSGSHDETVFDKVVHAANALSARSDSEKVIGELVEAPLAGVYQAFASRSAEDILDFIERKDWAALKAERWELDIIDRSLKGPLPRNEAAGSRRNAAWVVRYSEKGNAGSVHPFVLSYQTAGAAEAMPVKMGFTLTPNITGPADLVNQLRSQNVFLSIERVGVQGTGRRAVVPSDKGERIEVVFDKVHVEGSANDQPFAFDFENGTIPSDLAENPLKALCWGLSMGGRRYVLGKHGEYILAKEDEDAQMEAMSRIIDAPIWLPEESVGLGAEWTHEWTGVLKHRENDGRMKYWQIGKLQEIAETGETARRAHISSKTTGKLDHPGKNGTGNELLFESAASIQLDSDRGLVLSTNSSGTIRSAFPAAGFAIEWALEAKCEALG
jgi:MoaA/NifB/PqqE/SkfB family radical SAM enzyme